MAFGIPGSLGAAILLSALVIKGLQPGPDMLTVNLGLTFSMIWDIAIANILAAGLLMLLSRQIAKIAFLPAHSVVPGVMVVLLMGAWVATSSMGDWWTCLAMAALGYVMKQGGWPRSPLILALVLGTLIENNFQLTMQLHSDFSWMYQRPIVVIIEIAIVATIVLAARGHHAAEIGTGEKKERRCRPVAVADVVLARRHILLAVFVAAFLIANQVLRMRRRGSFRSPCLRSQFRWCCSSSLATRVPVSVASRMRVGRHRQSPLPAKPGSCLASARFFGYLLALCWRPRMWPASSYRCRCLSPLVCAPLG